MNSKILLEVSPRKVICDLKLPWRQHSLSNVMCRNVGGK